MTSTSAEKDESDVLSSVEQHNGDSNSPWSTTHDATSATAHISLDSSSLAQQQSFRSFGSVPLQPGEEAFMLHPERHERPTSAPPPGFTDDVTERNRLAEEILQMESHHPLVAQPQPSHHPPPGGIGGGGGGEGGTTTGSASSSSSQPHAFSNLAAVLGTGLAESMMWNAPGSSGNTHSSSPANYQLNNTFIGPSSGGDDSLSWHRQTRHAASRLLGASPPKYAMTSGGGSSGGGTNAHTSSAFAGASSSSSGFPSALSTPHRATTERATTPVELTAGTKQARRNFQIGTNVVEPEAGALNDFSGLNNYVTSSSYGGPEMRAGTATTHASANSSNRTFNTPSAATSPAMSGTDSFLWSPQAPEFVPYDNHDNASTQHSASVDSGGGVSLSELSAQQAEAEIYQFLWDIDRNKPSRTICILRVSWLRAPDVRAACEAYGVLEGFRADFSSRGIYFCSYYDIRSAQYAAVELQSVLQRMLVLQRSSDEVVVRYCLALSSSSQFDESQLSLTDLPPHIEESSLANMLSSYGAVRSVFPHGPGTFLVEFYSVQDAKQALLELDSSQPWGPNVNIETGVRNPVERKRGRELLATLSRWRQQMNLGGAGGGGGPGGGVPTGRPASQQHQLSAIDVNDPWASRPAVVRGGAGGRMETLNPVMAPLDTSGFGGAGGGMTDLYSQQQNSTPQLVLGPDGRYQVIMPANTHPSFGGRATIQQPPAQQIVQGPNGQLYVIPVSNSFLQQASTPRMGNFQQQQLQQRSDTYDRRPLGVGTGMPYYTHVVAATDGASLGSSRSYRSNTSATEDKDNRHLMLDLEEVESGIDTRTSLMVRNIPNKYTQQMLLSEFEENGHGPGVIDFFYLPIDFKNRCNRGYAFINFVDYKDILMFHRRYFGKHWRTFNSDKICDITYARIQGKAAMLKRFENSALMEKDDEYKPLVFVSDGPNKGQRLPFPGPSSSMATHQQQPLSSPSRGAFD